MIKLLSATIIALSITVVLALLASYWLIITAIDAMAEDITVTATVLGLEVEDHETRSISVQPTTSAPLTNEQARLQWAND